jgi:hypothetical protein
MKLGNSHQRSCATAENGTLINGPTWVAGFTLPDNTPPAAPTGLTAAAGTNQINLTWNPNTEPDLAGYNLYRSATAPVPTNGTPVNGSTLITGTSYSDQCPLNGDNYWRWWQSTSNNVSDPSTETNTSVTLASAGCGLQFDGSNDYVTFGVGNTLATPIYTIETWFKRTGAGVGVSTGTGGITSAIPLITKGTSEGETSNVDINYFLGIDASTGVLIADFEEGAGGAVVSQNHPVSGIQLSAIMSGTMRL